MITPPRRTPASAFMAALLLVLIALGVWQCWGWAVLLTCAAGLVRCCG